MIQNTQNEIYTKNNLIELNLNMIKEDEGILKEAEKEKESYINMINEHQMKELSKNTILILEIGFKHNYQIKVLMLIFEHIIKNNSELIEEINDPYVQDKLDSLRNKIYKEFKVYY